MNNSSSKTTRKKILVIGATGFLGMKILSCLTKDKNIDLKAMSRKAKAGAQASGEVEWVKGDLMNPASLDVALSGVDVVVSSANGYMKESIDADFQGNKNLIEAAARAKVGRLVFLSIVNCEEASDVPHFHAKKVAEDLLKSSEIPYVIVRAPAFLDQERDFIADGVKAGRFYAIGDTKTSWSFVTTENLAQYLAKATTYVNNDINYNIIDVGWKDGAKNQQELAELISSITRKKLSIWTVPWFVFRAIVTPLKFISPLGYDLVKMFLFFKKGRFVSNITKQEKFFGPAPTSIEAITKWAQDKMLI